MSDLAIPSSRPTPRPAPAPTPTPPPRPAGAAPTGVRADPAQAARREVLSQALDYAQLARSVYTNDAPPGWQVRQLPDGRPATFDSPSGFQAAIYEEKRPGGRHVLAFRGTDEARDWVTNIGQGTGGVPPAYREALELTKAARRELGDDLVLTGHSKGGGLVQFSSLWTGTPGWAFNAAGLNWGIRTGARWHGVGANENRITHVNVRGELLGAVERDFSIPFLSPRQVGRVIEIAGGRSVPDWNGGRMAREYVRGGAPGLLQEGVRQAVDRGSVSLDLHGMNAVVAALQHELAN